MLCGLSMGLCIFLPYTFGTCFDTENYLKLMKNTRDSTKKTFFDKKNNNMKLRQILSNFLMIHKCPECQREVGKYNAM